MSRIVEGPPIGFVVDVVNGWSLALRHDEAGADGPAFPSRATIRQQWDVALPRVDDLVIADWADRVYRVFAAAPQGRVAVANRLLASLDLRPVLTGRGLTWRCPDDQAAGALLITGLIRYAIDADPQLAHLGACSGVRCRDAYVDRSQARTRRYCSTRCQDRTKTYRRRGLA